MMFSNSIDDLDKIRADCRSMVTTRAGLSAGASVVPFPGLDLGADIALLLEMIPTINRKFGLSPEQIDQLDPKAKAAILAIIKSLGSEMVGKYITKQLIVQVLKRVGIRVATKSVAKYVPIIGSIVSASISFGAIKIIGNSHIDECYEVIVRSMGSATAEGQ